MLMENSATSFSVFLTSEEPGERMRCINDALRDAIVDRKVSKILFSVRQDSQTRAFLINRMHEADTIALPPDTSPEVFVAIAKLMDGAFDYGVRCGRENIAANLRHILSLEK
jgi:hypothetical protein